MTKLNIYISILLLLAIPNLVAAAPNLDDHEAYLSVTNMNYNAGTNMMECEMKITAHDLEKAIRIIYKKPFDLDKENWRENNTSLIHKYLASKLKIQQGDQNIDFELLGYDLELTDEVWLFFQFPISKTKTFNYLNKTLTEQFSMQQNVTHVNLMDCEQSFVFTKYSKTQTFTCNE